MITKLIAQAAIMACMIGLSILVFIKGWGLTPQSWWWIFGVGWVGQLMLLLAREIINREGK